MNWELYDGVAFIFEPLRIDDAVSFEENVFLIQ